MKKAVTVLAIVLLVVIGFVAFDVIYDKVERLEISTEQTEQDMMNQIDITNNALSETILLIDKHYEPNFMDIVAQSVKSVVHVKCPQWQGSGFVIDKHIIVTARHVVEGVEDFEITFGCGDKNIANKGFKLHATRAISDKEHDVGFIWIEAELPYWMIAKVGSIKECRLGQDVFIIGSPYGDVNFNSVSKGIISGLNKNWDEIDPWTGELYGWEVTFTSDSAAHPGNSGGAVFTMDGVVRGVLVGGYSPVLNCSMPCDLFMPDIEQIRLMFIMDKYQFEKEPETSYDDPYYNDQEDSEYYRVQ